jgi:hypothetical protein
LFFSLSCLLPKTVDNTKISVSSPKVSGKLEVKMEIDTPKLDIGVAEKGVSANLRTAAALPSSLQAPGSPALPHAKYPAAASPQLPKAEAPAKPSEKSNLVLKKSGSALRMPKFEQTGDAMVKLEVEGGTKSKVELSGHVDLHLHARTKEHGGESDSDEEKKTATGPKVEGDALLQAQIGSSKSPKLGATVSVPGTFPPFYLMNLFLNFFTFFSFCPSFLVSSV